VYHVSIWGAESFVWGGYAHQSPPRGDGTVCKILVSNSVLRKDFLP